MTSCAKCGLPIDGSDKRETHHHNETKGDNDPGNLQPTHRRCHHRHHENDRLTDTLTEEKYGPRRPRTSPR